MGYSFLQALHPSKQASSTLFLGSLDVQGVMSSKRELEDPELAE